MQIRRILTEHLNKAMKDLMLDYLKANFSDAVIDQDDERYVKVWNEDEEDYNYYYYDESNELRLINRMVNDLVKMYGAPVSEVLEIAHEHARYLRSINPPGN